MIFLLIVYGIYLLIYALVSYAIIYHLIAYQIPGDKSRAVLTLYIVLSIIIVVGSIVFLRPVLV